jgi:formylglycine-generating enzyme required for sulfatase activity
MASILGFPSARLVLAIAIAVIGRASLVPQATPTPAQTATATDTYRESIPGTLVTFEMVHVPGGSVTIDGKATTVAPFYIGKTEVTWDMYDVFALGLDKPKEQGRGDAIARPSQPYGAPDYGWGHAGYAVISVTRAAAEAFATWLSGKTGKKYRLPTEAEWLQAAQLAVGKEQLGASRRDALAWHRDNASGKTHPVASKSSDALGLFDLFGNAAEWVTTTDDTLVTRGGSFRDPPDKIRPDARAIQDPSWNERDPQLPKSRWWLSDGPFVGFRLVRSDHD